jgi:hypothetical protein
MLINCVVELFVVENGAYGHMVHFQMSECYGK